MKYQMFDIIVGLVLLIIFWLLFSFEESLLKDVRGRGEIKYDFKRINKLKSKRDPRNTGRPAGVASLGNLISIFRY